MSFGPAGPLLEIEEREQKKQKGEMMRTMDLGKVRVGIFIYFRFLWFGWLVWVDTLSLT